MMQSVADLFRQMKPLILGAVAGWHNESTAIGCRVGGRSAQNIPNNATAALSFDTEISDTGDCFAPTSTRLYAPRAGYYDMGGGWGMNAANNAVASRMSVLVRKNGDTVLASNECHTIANVQVQISVAIGMVYMAAGDYVEILAYQTQGGVVARLVATQRSQDWCFGWLARHS